MAQQAYVFAFVGRVVIATKDGLLPDVSAALLEAGENVMRLYNIPEVIGLSLSHIGSYEEFVRRQEEAAKGLANPNNQTN